MAPTLDSALLTGWTRAATQALERHRAEIDRINVFPVADGDTGTNLLLTMRAAAEAVRRVLRENGDGPARGVAAVAGALARGALVGYGTSRSRDSGRSSCCSPSCASAM